jgi:hypothetical protein
MPFNAITQPATEGDGVTDGATIDAALTAARASGADGDVFRVTGNGALYTFWKPSTSPGWLIPSEIYEDITLVSNGGDECYLTLSDTYTGGGAPSGTLVDRGWTIYEGANSTVNDKTDGNPWQITNSAGGSSSAQFRWTGSGTTFGATTNYFAAIKVEMDVVSTIGYQYSELRAGARRVVSLGDGAANPGHLWWINSTTKKGLSNLTADSTEARWIFVRWSGSTSNLLSATLENSYAQAAANYSDMASTSSNYLIALSSGTTGSSPFGDAKLYEFVLGAI